MALTARPPSAEDLSSLSLFYTSDSALADASFLVFYGPAQAAGPAASSSTRILSHVVSPAGLLSFPRLVISPASPLYAAVTCLSRQDQGDEVSRALAYSIFKYFQELPAVARECLAQSHTPRSRSAFTGELFGADHAAELASRMRKAPDDTQAAAVVASAFAPCSWSCADIDLVLPHGSLDFSVSGNSSGSPWADLVGLFGEPVFMPTSKMRRAKSKAPPSTRGKGFDRQQKESLRREICELLDTEENYVVKVDRLLNEVAAGIRNCPTQQTKTNIDVSTINALFPASLDTILDTNSGFHNALLAVVEATEHDAIEDIEHSHAPEDVDQTYVDRTGVTNVAQCLLDWFPRFHDCYGQYINAHAHFASVLKGLAASNSLSQFLKNVRGRVEEFGEQKLLSLLIEPVQRLPRYSLYLDNMTKQLPILHPALPLLLKAKDIVADLCAQDSSSASPATTLSAIKSLVKGWPSSLNIASRLISTIDLSECFTEADVAPRFIGLLFSSHLLLVSKDTADCFSAHGLFTELNMLSARGTGASSSAGESSLTYHSHIDLAHAVTATFDSDRGLALLPSSGSRDSMDAVRTFQASGPFEARVSRFAKDFHKARIERRYPEIARESGKWEVRELDGDGSDLSLVTAVHEGFASESAPQVCILANGESVPKTGAAITASIQSEGEGFYRLEVASTVTRKTKDMVTRAEFLPILIKRLSAILPIHYSMSNPDMADMLQQHNTAVLASLRLSRISRGRSPSKTKSARSPSPVKALANLFGGPPSAAVGHKRMPLSQQIADRTRPSRPEIGRKAPSESEIHSMASAAAPKVVVVDDGSSTATTIESLEACLGTYLLALGARKGNVVGKSITNRPRSDDPDVQALHNAVLNRPTSNEAPARAAVDALFAAFEVFLNKSWPEHLGFVLNAATLEDLRSKCDHLSTAEYDEYVQNKILELAPQNQRALKSILETFVNLLDGMPHYDDRGCLMVVLAEIMVSEGSPLDFITIFDRLIEDAESNLRYADDDNSSHAMSASMASSVATRSTQSSSLGSKASSLTRRFGFNTTGDGSKPGESRLGNVFRTMSKSSKIGDGSLRGKMDPRYQKSIDSLAKSSPRSRPGSKGDSPSKEASPAVGLGRVLDPASTSPTKQQGPGLESTPSHRRPKRRSSLSDLKQLPQPNTSPFWDQGTISKRQVPEQSPLVPRPLNSSLQASLKPARTPSERSTGSPVRRAGTVWGSRPMERSAEDPFSGSSSVRAGEADKKENASPEKSLSRGGTLKKSTPLEQPDFRAGLTASGLNRSDTLSRSPASGRRTPGQISPQKLNARVQGQRTAMTAAESSLRSELAKIGEELASMSRSTSPVKIKVEAAGDGEDSSGDPSTSLQVVSNRTKALESKVQHTFSNLTRQIDVLQRDVDELQLRPVDPRVAGLQQELYAARSEQDALKRRHEEDTKRIFEANRRGRPQSEMERKMGEAMDEAARWRDECAALRQENASLRAKLEGR